jgi:hypothetical protein
MKIIFSYRFAILGVCLVMGSAEAFADVARVNPRPRSLSMGGAGVAVAGDKDSASINPAGLADITKTEYQIFPILVEAPLDFDVISSGLDYKSSLDGSDKTKQRDELEKFLRDVQSSSQRMRVNFYPSYTRKYFHAGLLAEGDLDAKMQVGGVGADFASEAGRSNITAGLILGGGYGFLNNSLQVGVTLKPLYRFAIFEEEDQRPLDILKGKNQVGGKDAGVKDQLFGKSLTDNKAFGIGGDLGVKYWVQDTGLAGLDRAIGFMKPSVGVTLQDVGKTRFFTSRSTPADIDQSLSAGFAFHPTWKLVQATFAFDVRNLLQKEAFENKIHFGAEARIIKFILVRAGLSQLYLTGGLGLDFHYFQMDAYYASQQAYEYAHNKAMHVVGLRLAAAL